VNSPAVSPNLAKFPEPGDLRAVRPIWHGLPAGTLLWRSYRRGGTHPASWDEFRRYGPVRTARFDHHLPPSRIQDRGILYLALNGPTTLAEVLQDTRVINPWEHEPWLVAFETDTPLRLLDLTGPWPTQAGASMAINIGRRDRAQRWSQAIFEAYPDAQGLWYPSSMDANNPCAALYERGRQAVPANPSFHAAVADPKLAVLVHNAADRFRYRVIGALWRP
jgi:hypothetical protein